MPLRSAAGFTLLELMVTISIASILLALAVPQFTRFGLAAARAKGATELYGALTEARSEAVARNAPVTLCRRDWYSSAAFPQCATAAQGTWAQGWLVYQDADGDFSGSEPDSAADLITAYDRIGQTTPTHDGDAFAILTSMEDPTHVSFQANGRAGQRVQFTLCETRGVLSDARLIDVSLSGRVSLVPMDKASLPAACP
ncbi:MAG: GspH/FimT family pseudopilin [Panacagrimonas sp.]